MRIPNRAWIALLLFGGAIGFGLIADRAQILAVLAGALLVAAVLVALRPWRFLTTLLPMPELWQKPTGTWWCKRCGRAAAKACPTCGTPRPGSRAQWKGLQRK